MFTFSNNVGSFERGLTEFSINTWRCNNTEIHWAAGGNTNSETFVANDGINLVVEVDPSTGFLNNAEAAVIIAGSIAGENYAFSCNSNSSKVYYTRNIDVLINQNTNFSNMELAEARRIFLHEFGHAHMLSHASSLFGSGNPQVLMYYTADFNNAITQADLNGALTIFAASAALMAGDCPDPIDTKDCTNAVEEIENEERIHVLPVPFDDQLLIRSETTFPSGSQLVLYNQMAIPIFAAQINQDKNEVELKGLSHLPTGIYFLRIISEHGEWTSKTIKTGSHE